MGTVNDLTFKNQFGETSICDLLSAAAAGGTAFVTAASAASVTGKALTGFVSGAGTLSATDTILTAFNKLSGNTQNRAVTANLLTGLAAGANTPIVAGDTILVALANLQAQISAL